MCTHNHVHRHTLNCGDTCGSEKRGRVWKRTVRRHSHWEQSIHFAPGSIDKPGSQLVQESTPHHPTLLTTSPILRLGLVLWTWHGQAGMLKQVMFTCTSKAIKYKHPGLRWLWRPSHLGLTSWKHLASSCLNSIQVHFGLTQAPPLLVEVIQDYRATVVICWYNVFL